MPESREKAPAKVVAVSGSRSGSGKTLLAERLLPILGNCAAIKVQTHGDAPLSVVEETVPTQSPGKDTARYLAAGARKAYLVHGAVDQAETAVHGIIESGDFETVLVESNALACRLQPDLAFFVRANGDAKASAEECERRADIIVSNIVAVMTDS